MDEVWMAAKFTVRMRRARFRVDRSSPCASSINHMSMSFWKRVCVW